MFLMPSAYNVTVATIYLQSYKLFSSGKGFRVYGLSVYHTLASLFKYNIFHICMFGYLVPSGGICNIGLNGRCSH